MVKKESKKQEMDQQTKDGRWEKIVRPNPTYIEYNLPTPNN